MVREMRWWRIQITNRVIKKCKIRISEGDLNVGHIATRVVESVLFNEEDVLMDDDFSKMSNKRKSPENKSNTERVTKVSKMHPMA